VPASTPVLRPVEHALPLKAGGFQRPLLGDVPDVSVRLDRFASVVANRSRLVGCGDASTAPQSIARVTPASRCSTHQSRCHCMVGWPGWPDHTGR